jgi:hypothetical protein
MRAVGFRLSEGKEWLEWLEDVAELYHHWSQQLSFLVEGVGSARMRMDDATLLVWHYWYGPKSKGNLTLLTVYRPRGGETSLYMVIILILLRRLAPFVWLCLA